jgi:hypothetical protein
VRISSACGFYSGPCNTHPELDIQHSCNKIHGKIASSFWGAESSIGRVLSLRRPRLASNKFVMVPC